MHKTFISLLVVVLFTLAGCGGGDDTLQPTANVYKSMGSVQCAGGGKSLMVLTGELASANVPVLRASCGIDGFARAAVCGGADGRIGIFEIPAAQLQLAAGAGFQPLQNLPSASVTPCA